MRKMILLTTLCGCLQSFAQEFDIRKVELTPQQVILYYDLVDTTRSITYSIYLYSSRDNFLSPLNKVSGDLGLKVTPGVGKRIVWESKTELGDTFNGNVEVEIRGRAYIPFIRLVDFNESQTRKRTVPFFVKWTGGTRQNILNFQLYRENELVQDFPNAPNENELLLIIPKSVKPATGYYLRISDAKNAEQVIVTSPFRVKRRIPLLLKGLPIAVVGGAIYLFTRPDADNNLRLPPDVPENSN